MSFPPELPPKPHTPTTATDTAAHENELVLKLKALPLPLYLTQLPMEQLKQFNSQHELLKGYIKSLPEYSRVEAETHDSIARQTRQLNSIIDMVEEYEEVHESAQYQLREINEMKRTWEAFETIQFEKLAKFSAHRLKEDLVQAIAAAQLEGDQLVASLNEQPGEVSERDFGDFIAAYTATRKTVHLRREKLARWGEERVAGLM